MADQTTTITPVPMIYAALFTDPNPDDSGIGAYIFNYANIQTIQQNGSCAPNNKTSDFANALIAGINAVNGVS